MSKAAAAALLALVAFAPQQPRRYATPEGAIRVALAKQPFSPNGLSKGPDTMANGGIQQMLASMNAVIRIDEATLTAEEDKEYGGWKRLGYALGHFADIVSRNERDNYFTVGLFATCPSMPGMVAGLQRSGPGGTPLKIGMLWLDAHPDFNTPETTRSGSLGGMPVAVATGRALHVMRKDAKLDPPLADELVVMGGVRLTDPLEQELLDKSAIRQVSVADLQRMSPAVWAELDRLNRIADKLYIHIDMDVLDPREVMDHGNKVPGGPSSEELARLFEEIFRRYAKASAIGFATIPNRDEGGLSIAAVNRMIAAAVKGVKARGPQPAAVTPEDLAVIDAALDHKARTAMNLARPAVILMDDYTIAPCVGERFGTRCFHNTERTVTFLRPRMPEVTKARLDALAARNASATLLPSAPAKDVILVDREKLAGVMKDLNANVTAHTSLPAYFEDGTALLFLGYYCGGLCGEGNFLLLKKQEKGWRVVKSMMTWIS